jgi:hypothetical protein
MVRKQPSLPKVFCHALAARTLRDEAPLGIVKEVMIAVRNNTLCLGTKGEEEAKAQG